MFAGWQLEEEQPQYYAATQGSGADVHIASYSGMERQSRDVCFWPKADMTLHRYSPALDDANQIEPPASLTANFVSRWRSAASLQRNALEK
jgi:hypothetical protein